MNRKIFVNLWGLLSLLFYVSMRAQTMPPKKQSIVMVFGVFDLLHEGHRSFLSQAAAHGSHLIAVITRDSIVQLLKKRTPRNNEIKRLQQVKSVPGVSEAVLGDAILGTYGVVKTYRPDIICLGYDQTALERDLKMRIAAGSLPAITLVTLNPYKPELYHSSLLLNSAPPKRQQKMGTLRRVRS